MEGSQASGVHGAASAAVAVSSPDAAMEHPGGKSDAAMTPRKPDETPLPSTPRGQPAALTPPGTPRVVPQPATPRGQPTALTPPGTPRQPQELVAKRGGKPVVESGADAAAASAASAKAAAAAKEKQEVEVDGECVPMPLNACFPANHSLLTVSLFSVF